MPQCPAIFTSVDNPPTGMVATSVFASPRILITPIVWPSVLATNSFVPSALMARSRGFVRSSSVAPDGVTEIGVKVGPGVIANARTASLKRSVVYNRVPSALNTRSSP